MQNIAILGSTGSIGVNALKVIENYPDKFRVIALSAFDNVELLAKQAIKFRPKYIAANNSSLKHLKYLIGSLKTKILDSSTESTFIASLDVVNTVLLASRGSQALEPFLSAVKSGKRVAPANKEALVIAGDIIMKEAKKSKAEIIPIDSEQSAIFQCIDNQKAPLKKVYLTASGGPLLTKPKREFKKLQVEDILNHPRWKMGAKITVDSATLMNKGFEFIEAQRLFNLSFEQINILVHPQAIIHSMVEYQDGSILAQLAITDMRIPIQYALTYPQRFNTGLPTLDLIKLKELSFKKPDLKKFPALELSLDVAKKAGTYPAVLNAADEIVVDAFLKRKASFSSIVKLIEKVVHRHKIIQNPSLADVLAADQWAREEMKRLL